MSKLEQLIKELCPDGVEWKRLGKVAQVGTGSSNGNEAEENGIYPFFVRSQTIKYKNDFEYDEEAIIIPGEGGVGEIFHYINGKYAIHQRVYRIHIVDDLISTSYVYHYMKSNFKKFILKKAVSATVTSIRKPMIEDFPIPLPPLPIQEEIVRILDNFTELTAELTAELTDRKKQYEYYRDSLLLNNKHNRVSLKSMVKKSCSGGTPKKNNSEFYLNGTVPWLRTQDVKFNEIHEIDSFITEEAVNKTSAKWIPANCVIVAISGASAGRCAINKIPTTTNQHCYNMEIDESKALYKYVYYCVCSQYGELLSKKQGARGDLNSTLILGIEIPIPYANDLDKSLAEQQRIVDILDRFDTLCNNISIGLPAEIEERQKQYEHYRDKLLAFAKLDVEV